MQEIEMVLPVGIHLQDDGEGFRLIFFKKITSKEKITLILKALLENPKSIKIVPEIKDKLKLQSKIKELENQNFF